MANPFVVNDATWTDAVVSAVEARNALANTVAHDAAGARAGIFWEGTSSLIAGTATTSPSMTVQVSPVAWCGQKSATEGVYLGRSPGTVTVDVAAAPASNSRIDAVYVMQRDSNSSTAPDSVTQGEIGIVTGTAAVSPTQPAIPTGAVLIGTVTVSSGVTATTNAGVTIATTCAWTTGQGAPIPVRNSTELAALSPFDGLRAFRFDTHEVNTYANGAWQPGAWTAYTPNWSQVGGTVLSIGNGTLTGYYKADGKRITYMVTLVRGSTTNLGSAAYVFDLPFAAPDIYYSGVGMAVQSAVEYPVVARGIGANAWVLIQTSNNARLSNSSPGGGWASGDIIQATITYRSA